MGRTMSGISVARPLPAPCRLNDENSRGKVQQVRGDNSAVRPCADLSGDLKANLRMLPPALTDVLVVPLLARDEVVTWRHLDGNALWYGDHTLDEFRGEPVDSN